MCYMLYMMVYIHLNFQCKYEHNKFWWLYNQLYQVIKRLYTLACITLRCHVNGYTPCCITLKSSAPPPPPQLQLRADLQQIGSKVYLFTHRQAGQPLSTHSERPCPESWWTLQWPLCHRRLWPPALLTPCQRVEALKVGNILVLHPTLLAVPGVILVLPALFVPSGYCSNTLSSAVLRRWNFCHIRRPSLWRPEHRWSRLGGKMKTPRKDAR